MGRPERNVEALVHGAQTGHEDCVEGRGEFSACITGTSRIQLKVRWPIRSALGWDNGRRR